MEAQRAFDLAAWHMILQNKRAWSDEEQQCLYLTEDGSRCAVGILIPDGHPAQHELSSVEKLYQKHSDLYDHIGNIDLMEYLQGCHDEYEVEDWPRRLREIANMHALDYSVVDRAIAERDKPKEVSRGVQSEPVCEDQNVCCG